MPYIGERANRSSHSDISTYPLVARFLEECSYTIRPSEEAASAVSRAYIDPPDCTPIPPHEDSVSIDGSNHIVRLTDRFPGTEVGVIKVGTLRLSREVFDGLSEAAYVDPFKIAALEDGYTATAFPVPGINTRVSGLRSPSEIFRYQLNQAFFEVVPGSESCLMETFFILSSMRRGSLSSGNSSVILVERCPECSKGPVPITIESGQASCPSCGSPVYPTDSLGLWETDGDPQGIESVTTRVMNVIERLLMVHQIRSMENGSPDMLEKTAFILDGPLAVFGWGTCQWLYAPIMEYLYALSMRLGSRHLGAPLIMGLLKSGYLVEHARIISQYLPNNRLTVVDDDYRYRYTSLNTDTRQSKKGFGSESYFGQDFIYRSKTGHMHVFALPYPFLSKEGNPNFLREKVELSRYTTLGPAVSFINYFEADMFQDSLVPVILAHRFTSISRGAGGRMIDQMTVRALDAGSEEPSKLGYEMMGKDAPSL